MKPNISRREPDMTSRQRRYQTCVPVLHSNMFCNYTIYLCLATPVSCLHVYPSQLFYHLIPFPVQMFSFFVCIFHYFLLDMLLVHLNVFSGVVGEWGIHLDVVFTPLSSCTFLLLQLFPRAHYNLCSPLIYISLGGLPGS